MLCVVRHSRDQPAGASSGPAFARGQRRVHAEGMRSFDHLYEHTVQWISRPPKYFWPGRVMCAPHTSIWRHSRVTNGWLGRFLAGKEKKGKGDA
jgi:hypothetical protein